jgi:REP element-mobilizing transposase RayT
MIKMCKLSEKKNEVFHVTWVKNNSRYSKILINLNAEMDLNTTPLSEKDERSITQTIADILKKDNLYCLAYNICSDHVHILLGYKKFIRVY